MYSFLTAPREGAVEQLFFFTRITSEEIFKFFPIFSN